MGNGDVGLLSEWLRGAERAVFFGGAGVSTGSGIPDFRGKDGQYRQEWEYPLEEILGIDLFQADPSIYYRYHRTTSMTGAKPNMVHRKLAELEAAGNLSAVVTQNIDGLHQKAGSRTVWELHGSLARLYCEVCERQYDDAVLADPAVEVPRCECGGVIRPDIVFYGEGLDERVVEGAVRAIAEADVLVVGGTSLVVYPAAGLVNYYRGDKLVLINATETPYDWKADLVLRDDLVGVFSRI